MEKATLNLAETMEGQVKKLDPKALYLVDFTKLNSVNDLVLILSSMGISFKADHPHIEVVKPFLNLDNPIYLEGNKAEQKDLKLPKLKQVK